MVVGVGTMIAAGALHFFLSRRGGGDSGPSGYNAYESSHSLRTADTFDSAISIQSSTSAPSLDAANTSFDRGDILGDPSNGGSLLSTLFVRIVDVIQKIVNMPSTVASSVQASIAAVIAFPVHMSEKCTSGWEWLYGMLLDVLANIFSIPSFISSDSKIFFVISKELLLLLLFLILLVALLSVRG